MTSLHFNHVGAEFDGCPVLLDLTVRVEPGEWLGVIGPNGAGKTTLLRAVAGNMPYSGEISIGGTDQRVLRRRALARTIAHMPQRPLVPEGMRVVDYVALGRTPHMSYLGTESTHDLEVVAQVVERLDLSMYVNRPLGSLSGGEVQRAVLAQAIAQEASVLLLDEPTSALDLGHQWAVLELVDELRRERGLTVISAMHDLGLVGQFCDRVLLLDRGATVAYGSPVEVLTSDRISALYDAPVRVDVDAHGRVSVTPIRSAPLRAVSQELAS
jgi:iron complex transport system ATP-binding protein